MKFLLICQLALFGYTAASSDCLIREYAENKKVCVCNSEHCDYYSVDITPQKINVMTSTQNGKRYKKSILDFDKSATNEHLITIDRRKKYQKIIGFGGAITDSAGMNIMSLPEKAKKHLIRSYFSENGSWYNLCRIPMGATDFSTHLYSYDDGAEDPDLKNFKLADEDYKYKIPVMKLAQETRKVKFFSSSWIAPTWMKQNQNYTGGYLKNEHYQTWVNYFLKFLSEYKKNGLDFWGITTGNEITFMKQTTHIPAVKWEPEKLSLWIRENLGPSLKSSNFSNIKLLTIDDQRSVLYDYLDKVLKNETTRNYVDGFSVHWYEDTITSPTSLSSAHKRFPDKFILYTEACNGFMPNQAHVDYGSWKRAEDYAADIIDNLNHWVVGWVDWNMALNTEGGPSNITPVDAPIIVNATAGEFYKQPMYYAIGHFSKFIPEGSSRIQANSTIDLPFVALLTPQSPGSVVLVILNKKNTSISISIKDESNYINLNLEKKSITTVVY